MQKYVCFIYVARGDLSDGYSLTATQYARMMTLKGVIKNRFSTEQLDLMRKIAGVANNVNQMAKRLNQSLNQYAIHACGVVMELKKLIDDSKKH